MRVRWSWSCVDHHRLCLGGSSTTHPTPSSFASTMLTTSRLHHHSRLRALHIRHHATNTSPH